MPAGYVSAAGNGSTTIRVTHAAGQLSIPVKVSGVGAGGREVDFRTEVEPFLSKLGCNAGGCHGKASGQNGFKLSLFGFDVDYDYAAITKEARGRRLFPAAPDRSLFLLKASGQVPHGGGKPAATRRAPTTGSSAVDRRRGRRPLPRTCRPSSGCGSSRPTASCGGTSNSRSRCLPITPTAPSAT